MKIDAITNNPVGLLNAITVAIKNDTLKTWTIVNDAQENKYFTHIPEQWYKRVIVQSSISPDKLTFLMYWYKDNVPDESTKGYYIGRFTEVLMVHFSELFIRLETYS